MADPFQTPLVIGIDEIRDWSAAPLPKRFAGFGRNTGNLVFCQALRRCLAGAAMTGHDIPDAAAEGADAIVLAGANWINENADFGALADRIEALDRPAALIGVGVQPRRAFPPNVKEGTMRLLRAASARSARIAARGTRTMAALEAYGIANARATGCPSLLLSGPDGPAIDRSMEIAPQTACLLGTRHMYAPPPPIHRGIFRLAFQSGTDIILQSELSDMYPVLGLDWPADKAEAARATLETTYGTDAASAAAYLRDHGRIFWEIESWIAYLRTRSLVIGTRIHGAIMGILAGRPTMLLTHDDRTVELAAIMGVPAVPLESVQPMTWDGLMAAVEGLDFDLTARTYPAYRAAYADLLAENGLTLRDPGPLRP